MSDSTSTPPSWAIDFVAGWCSGGVSLLACHPIDTVLTRLQAARSIPPSVAIAEGGGIQSWSMARQVVSVAGMTSLWRGSSVLVSAVPIQNALLMGGYGFGKRLCDADNDNSFWRLQWSIFVGGCAGGILQSFLMSPVELIKVHQQVHSLAKPTLLPPQIGGWTYWSRGLHATLWRDGIPHGIWFVTYDVCKTTLEQENNPSHPTWTIPLVSGAVAATVAWVVGYPFDLIKTRIQAAASGNNGRALTMWQAAHELMQESSSKSGPSGVAGIRGLYRGLGLKLTRAVPSSMIAFSTYEYVAQLF